MILFVFVVILQDQNFNVEEILKERTKRGKKEYFVSWEGFSNSENTWEPYENLIMSSVFQDYLQDQKANKKEVSRKSKLSVSLLVTVPCFGLIK